MTPTSRRGRPPAREPPPSLDFEMPTLSPQEESHLLTARRLNLALVCAVPLVVGIGVLLGRYSLGRALPVAAIVVLGLAAFVHLLYAFPARSLVSGPLWIIAILLFASYATVILRSRLVATTILALVTLGLLRLYGRRPLEFYRTWLAADLRHRPADYNRAAVFPGKPRLWPLGALLAVAWYVPLAHSTTLAIVAVLILCVGFLVLFSARGTQSPLANFLTAYRGLKLVREIYLGEPGAETATSDETAAPEPPAKRRKVYYALTIPLLLTMTVSLSFCCPWELFAHHFNPSFQWQLTPDQTFRAFDWITSPFDQAAPSAVGYLWCFVIALPLLLLLPDLLLLTAYFPAFVAPAPPPPERAPVPTATDQSAQEWDQYVERLATSRTVLETDEDGFPEKTESEHLFLGIYPETQRLALLDRAVLHEHVYIVGQSGSGKTTLGIIPLLIQLIRGYERPVREKDGGVKWPRTQPAPILILDVKGDLTLFNTAKLEADRRGQAFLFFSADGRKATHCFDPFKSIQADTRPPIEVCELFIQALNLFHGEYYGASYYSRQHRDLLLTALDEARREGTPVTSWEQLYKLIDERFKGRRHRDAVELLTVIHALTFYDQLSLAKQPPGTPVIHMPTVIAEGQVVYFWLPSLLVNMSVREIAKLALYAFLTAAAEYHEAHRERRQSYVIIDEFQRVAAENMKVIMQQVRNSHVALILANQDPTDLKQGPVDIRSTVKTNTRMRQHFTVTDPAEMDELMKLSGEETQYQRTETVSRSTSEQREAGWIPLVKSTTKGVTRTQGYREIIRPRLSVNEIIEISNAKQDSLIHVIRDSGCTQLHGLPTRIHTPWAMTRKEYGLREATPWPVREQVPGAIVPTRTPEDVERKHAELHATMDQQILDVIDELRADEPGPAGDEDGPGAPAPPAPKPPKPPKPRKPPTKKPRRRRRDAPPEEEPPPGTSGDAP